MKCIERYGDVVKKISSLNDERRSLCIGHCESIGGESAGSYDSHVFNPLIKDLNMKKSRLLRRRDQIGDLWRFGCLKRVSRYCGGVVKEFFDPFR